MATGGTLSLVHVGTSTGSVTITGRNGTPVAFTVAGAAVTFPYSFRATTVFATTNSGEYTLSVVVNGREVGTASDGPLDFDLRDGAGFGVNPAVDDTEGALSGLRRTGGTVALLGASITQETSVGAGIYDTTVATPYTSAFGAFAWANTSLGHRLTLVKNAGVGGNTSAMIAARMSDVTDLPVPPDWCIVADAYVNDLITDIPTATILANMELIVSRLLARGIKVALCTALPSASFTTAGRKLAVATVAQWVHAQADRPGVVVVDAAPLLADPTTGLPKTGVTRADDPHMTNLGGQLVGQVLAAALRPYVVTTPLLVTSAADPTTLSVNPMLTGTAGTKGAGVTGSVADSWALVWSGAAGTAVASKVARTDDIGGSWQQVQMTGAGSLWFQQVVVAGYAAGDVVAVECEFDADNDWTNMTVFMAEILFSDGSASVDLYATEATPQPLRSVGAGVLRTPPVAVPAGSTYVAGQVVITGAGGTVRLGRCRVVKIV